MEIKVSVWVYTSDLAKFLLGEAYGSLYPLEERYQTQLLIDLENLLIEDEETNICKLLNPIT